MADKIEIIDINKIARNINISDIEHLSKQEPIQFILEYQHHFPKQTLQKYILEHGTGIKVMEFVKPKVVKEIELNKKMIKLNQELTRVTAELHNLQNPWWED